jgi:prepilin-type processing-associated H-X9-DG protein
MEAVTFVDGTNGAIDSLTGQPLGPDWQPISIGAPAPIDYGLCVGANALLTCSSPYGLTTDSVATYPGELRPGAGMFNVNSKVRVATVVDGMSNTIMAGEKTGGAQVTKGPNGNTYPTTAADIIPSDGEIGFGVDVPWSMGYIGTDGGTGGYSSVFGATAHNAVYNNRQILGNPGEHWWPIKINMVPDNKFARPTAYGSSIPTALGVVNAGFPPTDGTWNPDRLSGDEISIEGFRSYHGDFAIFLFGDGSVRNVNATIDARGYVGMSSIQGNEIITDVIGDISN